MASLAAVCGVLIVLFGFLTTRRIPNDAQFAVEVTSFIGGLVLMFVAVLLARVDGLARRLDGIAKNDALSAEEEDRD